MRLLSNSPLANETKVFEEIIFCLLHVYEEKGESYIAELLASFPGENNEFAKWLINYAKDAYHTYKMLECFQKFSEDKFERLAQIAMEYKILYNMGESYVANILSAEGYSDDEFRYICILLSKYFNGIIIQEKSREWLEKKFTIQYGIPENFMASFWRIYQQNEQKLWYRHMAESYRISESILELLEQLTKPSENSDE